MVVHLVVLASYIHGLYFNLQSGALLLKKRLNWHRLHFLLVGVLAKDDTNISMKKRSLHDDFLKKLICIIRTARCFIQRVKQVKINNKNCPIRMETFDDDEREH